MKAKTTAKTSPKNNKTAPKKAPITKKTGNSAVKQTKTAPVKSASTRATAPKTEKPIPKKVQKAEELRLNNQKDMQQLSRTINTWEEKSQGCSSASERREINKHYKSKVEELEKKEQASYKKYSDYVDDHFTKEQRKEALKKSGNFMSKHFTNALATGNKNGKK